MHSSMNQPNITPLPIPTRRCIIRTPLITDASDLATLQVDQEAMHFLDGTLPVALEKVCARIKSLSVGSFDFLVITLKESKELIGRCGLVREGNEQSAEIQIVLHSSYHKQCYGSEVLECLIPFGFTQLSLSKLWAHAHPENKGSQGLLKKYGFTQTGIVSEDDQSVTHWDWLVFEITRPNNK